MNQHVRKVAVGAALVATTLTGGVIGASLIGTSSAQTTSTTAPSSSAPAPPGAPHDGNFDPSKGGHQANGITETLLAGDDATKAKAAANAAVPNATIERVETDAEGAAYEAHMVKSDGSHVTVKMDKDFKVTGIETGGPGGPGGHGPRDQAPQSSTTPTSASA